MKKHLIALLISIVLATGSIGTAPVLAAESTTNESTETPTEETAATPVEETTETPTEESTKSPTEESAKTPEEETQVTPTAPLEAPSQNTEEPLHESDETSTIEEPVESSDTNESTSSANTVDSGTCGDDLTWNLDEEGVLTVSGSGEMDRYQSDGAPWYKYRESVKSIVVEEGVTSIGDYAFISFTEAGSILFPTTLTAIGQGAFIWCSSVEELDIPDGVRTIGEEAFEYCYKLERVHLPESVTILSHGIFSGCNSLTDVDIPGQLQSIGECAFLGCSSLKEIELPNTLTKIGKLSFSQTGFTAIPYLGGTSVIAEEAFFDCDSLAEINELQDTITTIDKLAFGGCDNLKSVKIPNTVTDLGIRIFENCCSLEEVILPDSIDAITESMFYFCKSLESIYILETVTEISDTAFTQCDLNILTIYGYIGSYAQEYAQDNDIAFGYIGDGHKWEEEYTVDKEPTTTEEGSESIHCSICGAIDENSIRVIPKKESPFIADSEFTLEKPAFNYTGKPIKLE